MSDLEDYTRLGFVPDIDLLRLSKEEAEALEGMVRMRMDEKRARITSTKEKLAQVIANALFAMQAGQEWDAGGYEKPVPSGGDMDLATAILENFEVTELPVYGVIWRNSKTLTDTGASIEDIRALKSRYPLELDIVMWTGEEWRRTL